MIDLLFHLTNCRIMATNDDLHYLYASFLDFCNRPFGGDKDEDDDEATRSLARRGSTN